MYSISIHKDISELQEAGVISDETASRISTYYKEHRSDPGNRLFIAFGILGSLLVGCGIILILAHNWDELSRTTKTFFAFLPLIVGQIACGYSLWARPDGAGWREASATFLTFSIGACIALISQIYNIPGDLSGYMLTWSLLAIPIVYVMRSSMTSLLYLIGITIYAVESNGRYSGHNELWFWVMILAIAPHYLSLIRSKNNGNFAIFHHWLIPICTTIAVITLEDQQDELLVLVYMCLFSLFYGIGHLPVFSSLKRRSVGYLMIGGLGSVVILLVTSFKDFWNEVMRGTLTSAELFSSEMIAFAILFSLSTVIFFRYSKRNLDIRNKPIAPVFLLFAPLFFIGYHTSLVAVAINLIILLVGVRTVRLGSNEDHLGLMNYGLIILTALVVCRFVDTSITFVVRGLLFILVGAGFFVANYSMLKKRKANASR